MSLWTSEGKCHVALDLNSQWSSNVAFGTCPGFCCGVICGHFFSTSWRDAGRCCNQKEIYVVITNRISPLLPIKSWQWIHSAWSIITHHTSKWKKKKSDQSVKSWKSALYFQKNVIWARWPPVFPKCHCGVVFIVWLLAFHVNEGNQVWFLVHFLCLSESSKGACLLSKHR